jgi:hypothetical protein
MLIFFHGTLLQNIPAIMERGIEPGEGWGGAGTSGVFLSGTPGGGLYWAKMAYQREHGEKLEIHRFDQDHGGQIDELLAVVAIRIPKEAETNLRADEEQFEDVGADFAAEDWKQSLKKIGDVRFNGMIPHEWIAEVIQPSLLERSSRQSREALGNSPMCDTGKRQFQSAGQARNAAAKMMHGHRSRGSRRITGRMWAYRCPLCPFWHLTSVSQDKR